MRAPLTTSVLVLALLLAGPALAQEGGGAPEGGAPAPAAPAPEGGAAPPPAPPPAEGGGESGSGSFLVSPNIGLMLWTVLAFGITLLVLRRLAFPRIQEALDKRRRTIEESIEASERTRKEADELLAEYRKRLSEARGQAEDIVSRARQAGDRYESQAKEDAKKQHDEMLDRTRREIEHETQRAVNEIRKEVADLTVMATERVTRKSLDGDDHRRLVDEALTELDFSALGGDEHGDGSNGARASENRRSEAGGGER